MSGDGILFLEQVDKEENAFENRSLPISVAPSSLDEYESYLNMSTSDMERLSVVECSMISLKLNQYAFYIQRLTNATKAKMSTVKSEINRCIASTAHQFNGQWDLQREQAINENDYCKDLNKLLITLQNRADRLDGISTMIKNIAEGYKNLKFDKMNKTKVNIDF